MTRVRGNRALRALLASAGAPAEVRDERGLALVLAAFRAAGPDDVDSAGVASSVRSPTLRPGRAGREQGPRPGGLLRFEPEDSAEQ